MLISILIYFACLLIKFTTFASIQFKTNIMKAKIKTKGNYRELNGTIQDVVEVVGNRVTCLIYLEDYGKKCQVDFSNDEVTILND